MAFLATVSASGGRVTPTLSRRPVSRASCPPFWGADAGASKSSRGDQSSGDSQPGAPREASAGAKRGREVGGVSRPLHNIRHAAACWCLLFTHRRGAPILTVRGHCQTCPCFPGCASNADRRVYRRPHLCRVRSSSFRAYGQASRSRSQEICGLPRFSCASHSAPRASCKNARSAGETSGRAVWARKAATSAAGHSTEATPRVAWRSKRSEPA